MMRDANKGENKMRDNHEAVMEPRPDTNGYTPEAYTSLEKWADRITTALAIIPEAERTDEELLHVRFAWKEVHEVSTQLVKAYAAKSERAFNRLMGV
jgi:hypothetical protein